MSRYGLALISVGAAIILATSGSGFNPTGILSGFIVIGLGALIFFLNKNKDDEQNKESE